jgi:modulator of FtsH protease
VDKKSFIITVYRIFIYSLIFSAMTAYAGVRLGIQFSWWWVVLEIVVFLTCLLIRDSLFMLYFYATISGLTSAPILSKIVGLGQVDIIWKAILATIVLFTILSIYVHVSKRDFSHWRAILFALLTLLVLSIIPLTLFPDRTTEIVWSLISIFIFSSYVLYDTSEIINRHKPGEEVMAALDLHLDFVNLFWDFIRIFRRTNSPTTENLPDATVDTGLDITTDVD